MHIPLRNIISVASTDQVGLTAPAPEVAKFPGATAIQAAATVTPGTITAGPPAMPQPPPNTTAGLTLGATAVTSSTSAVTYASFAPSHGPTGYMGVGGVMGRLTPAAVHAAHAADAAAMQQQQQHEAMPQAGTASVTPLSAAMMPTIAMSMSSQAPPAPAPAHQASFPAQLPPAAQLIAVSQAIQPAAAAAATAAVLSSSAGVAPVGVDMSKAAAPAVVITSPSSVVSTPAPAPAPPAVGAVLAGVHAAAVAAAAEAPAVNGSGVPAPTAEAGVFIGRSPTGEMVVRSDGDGAALATRVSQATPAVAEASVALPPEYVGAQVVVEPQAVEESQAASSSQVSSGGLSKGTSVRRTHDTPARSLSTFFNLS